MGEKVKWLLKEGGGLIFECFDIRVANLVWGVGVLLNNSDPLQELSAKEGSGLIFEGGLIFGRLRYST